MHLYLSDHSHLNSVLTNEDGQVLYKIETPHSVGTRTSHITCVVPNGVPRRDEEDTAISMQDKFAYFGQVEHNLIASSVLHFGGDQFETKKYFRKEGWGICGRTDVEVVRHRVFTGIDGREYKWLLRSFSCKLITNDDSNTVVAKFHRESLGIIGEARPASLEIFETGEHMIQEILLTFVYIEKIRKDMERGSA
ncbi:hypothetical protein C0995_012295 [Termitomyces sp. Mi166|nr:hypothetical protein C0995_012295 [Termitomyces sp. Mi166\